MSAGASGGQASFFRTLLVAGALAALVALPFWFFDTPEVTGPIVFAEAGEDSIAVLTRSP